MVTEMDSVVNFWIVIFWWIINKTKCNKEFWIIIFMLIILQLFISVNTEHNTCQGKYYPNSAENVIFVRGECRRWFLAEPYLLNAHRIIETYVIIIMNIFVPIKLTQIQIYEVWLANHILLPSRAYRSIARLQQEATPGTWHPGVVAKSRWLAIGQSKQEEATASSCLLVAMPIIGIEKSVESNT